MNVSRKIEPKPKKYNVFRKIEPKPKKYVFNV